MKLNQNGKLRIFVASPGDVIEERELVSHVVDEIRRILEGLLPTHFETVRWETHAWPDIGEDAQDVINREIGKFDIFVGIMWRRFGTPTKRAQSGTDEEFKKAYNYFKKYKRPKVMFYFRKTPFYTTNLKEITQFRKVVEFRKKLEKLGVLFWEYDTPLQFERSVREHLMRQFLSLQQTELQEGDESLLDEVPPNEPFPPKPKGGSENKQPTVFLAYSHEDREKVKKIYENLRISGFNPWLDVENLFPGQMWHFEIDQAIKRSDAVVLLLSKNSVSKIGYFQKELRVAMDLALNHEPDEKIIIPVRLDQVEVPETLKLFHHVDYFSLDGVEKLINSLKQITQL